MKRVIIAAAALAACLSSQSALLGKRNIDLKEVTVSAHKQEVLHTLGYVREFSELTTGSDTVFLFREKWVDFMSPLPKAKKFQGWKLPRVLSSKSYYHFTNAAGLDSVSDRFNQHFSWSDWVQIPNRVKIPQAIADGNPTDTLFGRYRPTEIWRRDGDRIDLSVNVMADTASRRRWVPAASTFFARNVDFERFDVRYLFKNIDGGTIMEHNLDAMTVNIESNGRGRNMFRFNRLNEPYYVTTYAEMYVADREYISVGQARKLADNPLAETDLLELTPTYMADLDPQILALIARVENIDTIAVRTRLPTDHNLIGRSLTPLTKKQKIVRRLRGMLGLPMQKYDKSKKVLKNI